MKKTLSIVAALCLGINGFAQVPYLQDFEGTNPPAGWALTNTDGTGWTFGVTSAVSSSSFAPPAHTTFAIMNSDALGSGSPTCNDTMKTAAITGITTGAWLSFDYYFFGATTSVGVELFNVNVSTNGGTTWTQLANVPGIATNAWATVHYDLSAYAGQSINLAFVYNSTDSWEYGAAVDNISIVVPPNNSIQYTTIVPATGDPASYTLAGNNISVSGVVSNLGLNPITTYTVKYTDGTTTWSDVKTVNISTFATGTFTISTPYTVALGSHPIKSWVQLTGDANHTDDTLNTVLVGASFMPTHQMVVEEGTGCWCGWCPRGAVFMDSMKVVHPNDVTLIAVHDKTGGTDPMAVTVYDTGLTGLPNFNGFPSIAVDRKEILDPSQIFTGYADHGPDFGFADLTLTAVITGSVMNVSTTAKPAIDLNGTYQLALVITEDSVHNTASTYAQHNYYSSTSQNQPLVGAGHNWQTSPNPIPAAQMWFDHVARVIVGSFTGQTGSLPSSMISGTTYNYSFNNVPLTSTWNTNKLTADLLLIDVTTGQILNSKSVTPTISVGIKTESNYKNVTVYPNPTNNNFNVNVTLNVAQKATVSLCNITGQVMLTNNYNFNAGENLINISTDQLASGMYTLLISSESGVHITKVSIVK